MSVYAKMLLPHVTTQMEQGNLDLAFLVLARLKIRLEEIAGMTNQSEIVEVIGAATCLWEDIFHLEWKVKTLFGA